jgi:hypothetical protein
MVGWSSTRLVRCETPGLMASSLSLATARLVDFLEAIWVAKDLSGDLGGADAARMRNGTALSDVVRAKVCRSFSITAGGQAPSISQTRETYRPAHHLTHLAKPADAAPMVAPFRPAINAPTNMPRPAALAMFSVSCFQFRCGLIQGRTWDAFI